MSSRRRRQLSLGVLLGSLLLLLGTASASAAIRFAAPGGTAPAISACARANPCSLFNAASADAKPSALAASDEVVVEPGTYTDTAHDLGPHNELRLAEGISMHGEAGRTRPLISFSFSATETEHFDGVFVEAGDTVSDLEIQSASYEGISIFGGVVERVIVHGSRESVYACRLRGGLLRNSACFTTARNGKAVGIGIGGLGPLTSALRNVTAISTGMESFGLYFDAIIGENISVDAKGVLAEGTAEDVQAVASGLAGPGGGSTTINLRNSDFDTSRAVSEDGATAVVTAPGSGAPNNNVTAPPLLAADGFHELVGSPTIDNGALDGSSGMTDIDGQSRQVGAPDIGADERAPTTTTKTTVACLPASLEALDSASCTATVENDPAAGEAAGGKVEFSGSQPGEFSEGGACTLGDDGGGKASCSLTYTPTAAGTHPITATYPGNNNHDPSAGPTQVTVSRRETTTTLACAPGALVLGIANTTCTATVSDVSAGPIPAPGIVDFASDAKGAFDSGTCKLGPAGGGSAACHVTYTPSQLGLTVHEITASYQGDSSYEKSRGSTGIQVTALPVAAPNTMLTRRPRRKGTERRAKFAFVSDQAGSTFQCKLDKGKFKPCRSPFKRKVRPGRHTFRVRAVNSAGISDSTPAIFRWRVLPNT